MQAKSDIQRIARPLVAVALALTVALSMTRPVLADGAASTRNIILGAAAVVAGVVIANNVHHKHVEANTIVGYSCDGGTVYADGSIHYPDGSVVYGNASNAYAYVCNGSQYNGYQYNGYQYETQNRRFNASSHNARNAQWAASQRGDRSDR
ncbi:MAG: hypothetical protein JO347_05870 [Candidatus Eremiobacteraeota bacterium]|nr:hypothetical protein [Candidatus Eremiobacteraeota bacterium]MBV8281577.1 hypothetical protein [Candidatus Eremiobacteraeota bacterium]